MAPRDGVQYQPDEIMTKLAVIEDKLDRVLVFAAMVEATAAPFLKGKSAKYLALFAKAGGGGGERG